MSRITDVHRGAFLAKSFALLELQRLSNRDLFDDVSDDDLLELRDLWTSIWIAAREQQIECQALTAIEAGAYAG